MGGNRRVQVLLGVVLALAGASVAAAGTAAKAPAYCQEEGTRAVYTLAYTGTLKFTAPQGGALKGTGSAQMKYELQFLGLTPDEMIRVEGQTISGQVKETVNGKSQALKVEPAVAHYEMTPQGVMRATEGAESCAPGFRALALTLTPDDAAFGGYIAVLPKKPIKAGDRWTGTVTMGQGEGDAAEATVKFEAKALGQVSYAGSTCWKIRTTARRTRTEVESLPEGLGEGRVKEVATDTCVWLFDPGRGVVMTLETTGKRTYTAEAQMGEQTVPAGSGFVTYHVTSKLTEYNGEKVPGK